MLDWLYGLRHFGVKLGLDNIRALLAHLGRPDRQLPYIHVGGTNGKGSVVAMLDAMLRAHGLTTGMYTSPHLVRPNERIRIDGDDIDDRSLDEILRFIRHAIDEGLSSGALAAHPSFFEVLTACALQSFADRGMQAGLLEVGLGGRLDATNVVDSPVAVVVSLDLDHTKTLGPTLMHIAYEKAGIVKPGQTLISGVEQPEGRSILGDTCDERGARLIRASEQLQVVGQDADRFSLVGDNRRYDDLRVRLAGDHQRFNARIAVLALEEFLKVTGTPIDAGAVRDGLAVVRWPGRLQSMAATSAHPNLLLDAAHNPAGLAALNSYLARTPLKGPAVIVFGATSGKDPETLFAPLARHADHVVLTRPLVDRGVAPESLEAVAAKHFRRVDVCVSQESALRQAYDAAGPSGTVLITGSLYLVGDLLGLIEGRPTTRSIAM
ncbi:MAG: bifunctional folylpolyglutamate synthase/dihydrofolate synthase [Acidobacteriota bacterium]|nr:bifunctional folylpolyglutamate synthase/dihydrofolate synthase [Acidobacteriota bacterium]MDH3785882.1 bifunctional folylpolyglutamate synthase/dihydrofolate synthase [Acidobacteriota bacterium]